MTGLAVCGVLVVALLAVVTAFAAITLALLMREDKIAAETALKNQAETHRLEAEVAAHNARVLDLAVNLRDGAA